MYDDDLYNPYWSPYFCQSGISTYQARFVGDWTCEYCGSLHPGSEYTCTRCGAPRRAERPKPAPVFSPTQAAVWAVAPQRPYKRTFRERLRRWIANQRRKIGWALYKRRNPNWYEEDDYDD